MSATSAYPVGSCKSCDILHTRCTHLRSETSGCLSLRVCNGETNSNAVVHLEDEYRIYMVPWSSKILTCLLKYRYNHTMFVFIDMHNILFVVEYIKYVPNDLRRVVVRIPSFFPLSWLTFGFVESVTRRVPVVVQEVPTFPEHIPSPLLFVVLLLLYL